MRRTVRDLLKLLAAFVLLWQGVVSPAAAYAGCCQTEQPCCLLPAAASACAACAPGALAGSVLGRFTVTPAVQVPAGFVPAAGPDVTPNDIWRPPRPAASMHFVKLCSSQ